MLRSEIGDNALQSSCQSSRKRDDYGSRTCKARVSDSWGTGVGLVGHGLYFRAPRKYISSMLTIMLQSLTIFYLWDFTRKPK